MKKVPAEQVSRYRQEVSLLIAKLKSLCLKAGHSDLIFKGTPTQVYRKCGNPRCRCAAGGSERHGPYKVIQVWESGEQRQISLKRAESSYFEMAEHYQYQQQNRHKIVELQGELLELVERMIEARCICKKQ